MKKRKNTITDLNLNFNTGYDATAILETGLLSDIVRPKRILVRVLALAIIIAAMTVVLELRWDNMNY